MIKLTSYWEEKFLNFYRAWFRETSAKEFHARIVKKMILLVEYYD
jgi:hypothetical protein